MKKLLLFLVFSYTLIGWSQRQKIVDVDSLVRAYPKIKDSRMQVKMLNRIAYAYSKGNPDKGIAYANKALSLAQSIGWNDGAADAYINIGINANTTSDYGKALQAYDKALKLSGNKEMRFKALHGIGYTYTYRGNPGQALSYNLQALKIAEEINEPENIALSLANIGIIYFDLEELDKAEDYYQRALKINTAQGYELAISQNLGNLGNVYSGLKQDAKAIEYYSKAAVISQKINDLQSQSVWLGSIGGIYFEMGNYPDALKYTSNALAIAEKTRNTRIIAFNSSVLGDIYFEMAKENKAREKELYEKSIASFNRALEIHQSANSLKEISGDYEWLSDVYAAKGDLKKALEFFRQSKVYNDSVFNSDNKETIKNLEDKREIELRDKQIKLNKITLESKERQQWLYISGIGFLLIIAGLVLLQSRNRKKNNQKLQALNSELDEANKVKTRFFSILNHDLRSPVSNLISFLHLQKESPELLDEESKKRMETKTITSAENLLDSMEDLLLWSKGQMQNFRPQPAKIAARLIFEDLEKHFSAENISLVFENDESLVLFADENYVKTILRNLIGNAIKALRNTENPTIIVKAFTKNGVSTISVADNGPGGTQEDFRALYDEKEVVGIKTGLGLHLIRDLSKAIGCTISVESESGKGTVFTLSLTKYRA
jgi:signal transduction histidine kinase/Tfp pilus assembly protein PilF